MKLMRKFTWFFVPSVLQGVTGFIMLPVITLVLSPRDFGIYALVSAFTTFGSVLAPLSSSYLLAQHYPNATHTQREGLISSVLWFSMLIAVLFGLALMALWPALLSLWPQLMVIQSQHLYMSIATMLFTVPWVIAIDVISLKGSAHQFAVVTLCQIVVNVSALLLTLFVFKQTTNALFIAYLSMALVGCVGGLMSMRVYCFHWPKAQWVRSLLAMGISPPGANLLDNLQIILQRNLLNSHVGIQQLGLYAHARQYINATGTAINAVGRSIWPTTLLECEESGGDFVQTRRSWEVTYIFLISLGLLFATLGPYIIGVLTHQKFTQAYAYVALLLVVTLIQNAGKPHTGLFYATGRARIYAKMHIASLLLAVLLFILLVPRLGVYGVIIGCLMQQLAFRIGLQIKSRQISRLGFYDSWVVVGSVFIFAALILQKTLHLGLRGDLGLFVLFTGALILMRRSILLELFRMVLPTKPALGSR